MGRTLDPRGQAWPCFRVPVGGPPPHLLYPLSLPSSLGLQDKLNKRDKEVTALRSQTEVLRTQVSGKSPSRRADAGGGHASGAWSGWVRVLCLEKATWASPPALDLHLSSSEQEGGAPTSSTR